MGAPTVDLKIPQFTTDSHGRATAVKLHTPGYVALLVRANVTAPDTPRCPGPLGWWTRRVARLKALRRDAPPGPPAQNPRGLRCRRQRGGCEVEIRPPPGIMRGVRQAAVARSAHA